MPELPEVQTIRTQLTTHLPLKIEAASYSPVITSCLKEKDRMFSPQDLTIIDIRRKGKLLAFDLDDHSVIYSHLGMSGTWRVSRTPLNLKHTHVEFKTTGPKNELIYLAYVDPRRFGNLYFLNGERRDEKWNELGVDIDSPEFTPDYIHQTLKRYPNRELKPFLLDQKFFAGVGNYIACEICARAKIKPMRKAAKITAKECEALHQATKSVLHDTITTGGTTFSGGYQDTTGEKGMGVLNLVVFWQKTCQMCQGPVKKIELKGRGTFYCPRCQK